MRTRSALLVSGLVWVVVSLVVATCGSGSNRCETPCNKIVECGGTTKEECLSGCQEMSAVLDTGPWNDTEQCILDTPCETLSPDACIMAAAEAAPDTQVTRFLDGVCAKMVVCQSGLDTEACKTMIQTEMGNAIWMLKVLKASVVDCIVNCLSAIDCATLMNPDATPDPMETCTSQCGLSFD